MQRQRQRRYERATSGRALVPAPRLARVLAQLATHKRTGVGGASIDKMSERWAIVKARDSGVWSLLPKSRRRVFLEWHTSTIMIKQREATAAIGP